MPLLDDEARTWTARQLAALTAPVSLVLFTGDGPEDLSGETAELLHELQGLSEHIQVETHPLATSASLALRYGAERTPTLVLEGARDYGVRYVGAPAGYEFTTLLEAMVDVSRGEAELPADVRRRLEELRAPVKIEVFSTPT